MSVPFFNEDFRAVENLKSDDVMFFFNSSFITDYDDKTITKINAITITSKYRTFHSSAINFKFGSVSRCETRF